MIYHVRHQTTFEYAQPVSVSNQVLHLTPRAVARQRLLSRSVRADPAPLSVTERVDYFGNPVTYLTIQEPHRALLVESSFRVEVVPAAAAGLGFDLSPPWDQVASELEAPVSRAAIEASQFTFASPYIGWDREVIDYAHASFAEGAPLLTAVRSLTARVHRDFTYEGNCTDVWTPVQQVLAEKRGVCQDFAHLEVACLRALGLAARYVSGYVRTRRPAGEPKLVGADASHAWVAVWCPDVGWAEFDPTNDVVPDEEHITVAWGRDYGDVSPINGFIVGGGEHQVTVAVDVEPVAEY